MAASIRTPRNSRSGANPAERDDALDVGRDDDGRATAEMSPLNRFSPAVRDWFVSSFEAPTPAQAQGWVAISEGHHTLIHAPTGSGKTLAAFLWCLDRLARDPTSPPTRGTLGQVRVLYISPLKALTYDIERNLKAPLIGIGLAAQRLGDLAPQITVATRTGDTPGRRPTPDRAPSPGHPDHHAGIALPDADQRRA